MNLFTKQAASQYVLSSRQGDEWEEKWGERYGSAGWANKYADKWAKDGPNVWHERWGEDYDGGGGCVKYTDKARRTYTECSPGTQAAIVD